MRSRKPSSPVLPNAPSKSLADILTEWGSLAAPRTAGVTGPGPGPGAVSVSGTGGATGPSLGQIYASSQTQNMTGGSPYVMKKKVPVMSEAVLVEPFNMNDKIEIGKIKKQLLYALEVADALTTRSIECLVEPDFFSDITEEDDAEKGWYIDVDKLQERREREKKKADLSDIIVAGGAFTSLYHAESVNDIDVFILNSNKNLFHDLIFGKPGRWTVKHKSVDEGDIDTGTDYDQDEYPENPAVLATAKNNRNNIQYILTSHKSRQDLINDFDYLHCTPSYEPVTGKLYITPETWTAVSNKILIVNNKDNKSFKLKKDYRSKKFFNRGFKMPFGYDDGTTSDELNQRQELQKIVNDQNLNRPTLDEIRKKSLIDSKVTYMDGSGSDWHTDWVEGKY
jgi:hypothetical protein